MKYIVTMEKKRVGINMVSGEVFELSRELVYETPLAYNHPIITNFELQRFRQVNMIPQAINLF